MECFAQPVNELGAGWGDFAREFGDRVEEEPGAYAGTFAPFLNDVR